MTTTSTIRIVPITILLVVVLLTTAQFAIFDNTSKVYGVISIQFFVGVVGSNTGDEGNGNNHNNYYGGDDESGVTTAAAAAAAPTTPPTPTILSFSRTSQHDEQQQIRPTSYSSSSSSSLSRPVAVVANSVSNSVLITTKQNRTLILPSVSQWLDDIDTDYPSPCAKYKCFYTSKLQSYPAYNTNININNNKRVGLGYLVGQSSPPKPGKSTRALGGMTFQTIKKGYDFAHSLEAKYGIKHFMVGPPEKFNLTETMTNKLNQNTYDNKLGYNNNNNTTSSTTNEPNSDYYKDENEITTIKQPAIAIKYKQFIPTNIHKVVRTRIIISPVEIAPIYSIVFGCVPGKLTSAKQKLNNMMKYTTRDANNNDDSYDNKGDDSSDKLLLQLLHNEASLISQDDFILQLQKDYEITLKLLSHSNEDGNCLIGDFQIMIDPITGNIYHIDLDRCFEPRQNNDNLNKQCLQDFQNYIQDIILWKKKTTAKTTIKKQ